MAINWKNRAKKLEQDLLALHERAKEVGWDLVKEKEAHRKTANDLMIAARERARAVTAIDSAVEIFTAHDRHGSAATFRMIANDLRTPWRDAEGLTITPKDEQI